MRRPARRKRFGIADLRRQESSNKLAVFGFLLILFPLYFWFTVLLKFGLGINFLFDFWNYFYEDYLEFSLLLLPIPAFFIGWIALFRGKKHGKGILLSMATIFSSVITAIAWIFAAQRPG